MSKVTVIIPCYNREDYIEKTLSSVLEQSYQDIKIIAVDDGCTDSTRDILECFNSKITILEHPGRVNKGQSAAINLGICTADSEYIAILDSDDVLKENKIEKQVRFLDENPEYGFVYCNAEAIDGNGKYLYTVLPSNHVEEGTPERILLECPMGCPSAYLYRSELFDKVGEYDESLRAAQDHDMVIRLTEVAKPFYQNEVLWFKREHADSISAKQAEKRWRGGFVILEKACKRYPYSFNNRRRRLAVLHFRLGQCFMAKKQYMAGLSRILLAGLYDPIRALKVSSWIRKA